MEVFKFRNYQKACYDLLVDNKRFALFAGMALGKTALALSVIDFVKYDDAEIRKVLVVSTRQVAETVWTKEVEKWSNFQHLKVSVCVGDTPKKRIEGLEKEADIYTINVESLSWLFKYYKGNLPFDMLIVDESTLYKNHDSGRFKEITRKRGKKLPYIDRFTRVVLLTGTPAPRSLLNLWSQIYLLDKGERLGRTFNEFAYTYFHVRNCGNYNEYTPKAGATELIMNKIKDICISLETRHFINLPDVVVNDKRIQLSEQDLAEYKRFTREYVLKIDEKTLTLRTASALSMKLQQYTAGAIYDDEDNPGAFSVINNYKLDALADYMRKTSDPVIVAYNFKFDPIRIKERFPFAVEYSPELYDDWNAGKIRMLLLSPHKAAHGLNLQYGGRRLLWYSLIWDLEKYQQLVGRVDRPEDTGDPVLLTRLYIANTIDTKILRSLDEKTSTQRDVMNFVKLLIREYE